MTRFVTGANRQTDRSIAVGEQLADERAGGECVGREARVAHDRDLRELGRLAKQAGDDRCGRGLVGAGHRQPDGRRVSPRDVDLPEDAGARRSYQRPASSGSSTRTSVKGCSYRRAGRSLARTPASPPRTRRLGRSPGGAGRWLVATTATHAESDQRPADERGVTRRQPHQRTDAGTDQHRGELRHLRCPSPDRRDAVSEPRLRQDEPQARTATRPRCHRRPGPGRRPRRADRSRCAGSLPRPWPRDRGHCVRRRWPVGASCPGGLPSRAG